MIYESLSKKQREQIIRHHPRYQISSPQELAEFMSSLSKSEKEDFMRDAKRVQGGKNLYNNPPDYPSFLKDIVSQFTREQVRNFSVEYSEGSGGGLGMYDDSIMSHDLGAPQGGVADILGIIGVVFAIASFFCGIFWPNWCEIDDKDDRDDRKK